MTDAELYDTDFYAWTRAQADKLRRLEAQRANLDLDLPRLAEEVEDLGKSECGAVLSQLERIVEHGLKLEFSTAREPRAGWFDSIDDARGQIAYKLTPSLRTQVVAERARVYGRALRRARQSLHRYGETPDLPVDCPYPLDELLNNAWYPAGRRRNRTEEHKASIHYIMCST